MFRNRHTLYFTLACALALIAALPAMAAQPVVNVNTADTETLVQLPRIGPAVAQRIVEFREQNGRFKTKQDLMLVRGIGERTYELLEPYVVLDGDSTLKEKVRVPKAPAKTEG